MKPEFYFIIRHNFRMVDICVKFISMTHFTLTDTKMEASIPVSSTLYVAKLIKYQHLFNFISAIEECHEYCTRSKAAAAQHLSLEHCDILHIYIIQCTLVTVLVSTHNVIKNRLFVRIDINNHHLDRKWYDAKQ